MNIVRRSFAALKTTFRFDIPVTGRRLDALLVACAILAAGLLAVLPAKQSLLNIEIQAGEAGTLQVFFDQGRGFSEKLSTTLPYSAGTQALSFPIPVGKSELIRIDPMPLIPELTLINVTVVSDDKLVAGPVSLGGLAPSHEISMLEHQKSGAVKLSMPEGAADPQTLLPLGRPISSSRHAAFRNATLWLMVLTSTLLFASRRLASLQLPATQLYFAAFVLIVVMALLSPLASSIHPDEFLHLLDANYFQGHWIPPSLVNGDLVTSYTNNVYGVSYLYDWNVVYWFAGKFGELLSLAGVDPLLAYRLFNVLLMGLVGVTLLCAGMPKSAIAMVLVTPQLWYVFSYFNGDAFPLALGCIIVALAAAPGGTLQRFINGEGPLRWQVVLFALALGLLLISKKNYLPVALFSGLWLCASCLNLDTKTAIGVTGLVSAVVFTAVAGDTLQSQFGLKWSLLATVVGISGVILTIRWLYVTFFITGVHRRSLARLVAIHFIALLVAGPWVIADIEQNGIGEDKAKISTALREDNAAYAFKPSTIQSSPENSYPGLQLSKKGVTLKKMLVAPYDWLRISFRSFFSAYGYMQYFGPEWMYTAFGLFFLALLGIGTTAGLHEGAFGVRHVVLSTGMAGILIGAAALHSLTYDFQPQGRYVLGILPMLMPLLGGTRSPGSTRAMFSILTVCVFALSAYSFIVIGLGNII